MNIDSTDLIEFVRLHFPHIFLHMQQSSVHVLLSTTLGGWMTLMATSLTWRAVILLLAVVNQGVTLFVSINVERHTNPIWVLLYPLFLSLEQGVCII